MSAVSEPFFTPQQYLERERQGDAKHQYLNGQIFAMGGGSPRHNQIVVNISGELRQRLRERDCLVYSSDQRVKVSETGLYTYADVTVVCGEPQFDDERRDTLLNPRVLVEVLSPSTEDYDRGRKFEHYRRLPSLQEYVLIHQDRPMVEHHVRESKRWILTELQTIDELLPLHSIHCELPLAEVYFKVAFS